MTAEKILSVKVTRSIEYSPDAYLEFCEENDETPTQEGFMDFIRDWIDEDFIRENGEESIEYLTEDT